MSERDLRHSIDAFEQQLRSVKTRINGVSWYPYSTFSSFRILPRLIGGKYQHLLELIGEGPVVDVGCGDGSIAFLFEHLGFEAYAVDNPPTNYNGMQAIKELKKELQSQVHVEAADFDARFSLQGGPFALAICLGLLYHLKNPYYFLETLASSARYCFLSTRIAQVTAAGTPMDNEPLAYLLEAAETNNDPTNFWIFSDTGLRRLLRRSGWDVVGCCATGCLTGSNPVDDDRDRRAFCFLRSCLAEPWCPMKLVDGWHELEHESWRWTDRAFSIRIPVSPTPEAVRAVLRVHSGFAAS